MFNPLEDRIFLILKVAPDMQNAHKLGGGYLTKLPIGGPWMGGSPCRMSIIRDGNVVLSILRKGRVTLSNLRKGCGACR